MSTLVKGKSKAAQKENEPSFLEQFNQFDFSEVKQQIERQTTRDVELALSQARPGLKGFMALISPAAAAYLEPMAKKARQLTLQRFGKTIRLFAPLYLSNQCQNICTYCGFSLDNKIPRKTLSAVEIAAEAAVLKKQGFDQVLLVTGENAREVGLDYMLRSVRQLLSSFAQVSLEVQPLNEADYRELHKAGAYGITVYQETYHRDAYKGYHPKGRKANFDYRLATAERACKAGIRKVGMGVLLGLEDWRVDSFFTMAHLNFMHKYYWKTQYSISLPRLRPAQGVADPAYPVSDRELLQLIFAYRLIDPDLDISLSTRENKDFRDHLMQLGITTMSAGSKTSPGGYSMDEVALEQFEISDERTVKAVVDQIKKSGYDPIFTDWHGAIGKDE